MAIGHLRKWSHIGAPKLWANTYGSMVRLLEQVLVTGYGSYPGLGWTKEYQSPDTNIVVFRNNPVSGSGFYLQVIHSSTYATAITSFNTNFFAVNAFESMTDFETGLSKCPPVGLNLTNTIGNSVGTTCADGIHWMVIGDDRGFWLCTRYYLSQYADITSSNTGRLWKIMYFGDIIPMNSANQWPVILTGYSPGASAAVPVFYSIQSLGSVSDYLYMMRDSTLGIGSVKVGISSGSSYETSSLGYSPKVSPLYGQQLLTPVTVHDVNKGLMGVMPGCRNTLRMYGNNGIATYTNNDEEVVGYNSILHTLCTDGQSTADSTSRICLISGEGFRDAI